jgi:uncharacterized protein with von Willebrand factor type A (vWA) domain
MPANLDLESLVEIIDELRLAGYDISTQQYIAAQNLLIALAARGELSDNPRALRTWLAPVLCSSPREQENFYRYFDRWLARHPELITGPQQPGKSLDLAAGSDQPQRSWLQFLSRPWLRISVTILLITLGIVLVFYLNPRSRSLRGTVVDDQTNQSISGAKVSFKGKDTSSDKDGGFSVSYSLKELPSDLVVQSNGYETTPVTVTNDTSSPLTIRLPSALPPPTTPTPVTTPTPPRIPLLSSESPTTITTSPRAWIRYAAVMFPLLLFAGWWVWKTKLNRALLERLQQTKEPRLEQLTVKSITAEIFEGQSLRRTIQELRRHRRRGAYDLDSERTINRTIHNGGLFTPAYGSRQTLPEYLVLIDQASFADQQARLDTEIVRRLVRDNVFVDAYYFQSDPRLCRRLQRNSRNVTLQELAALHPDHHVLVFSDGASFINPLNGQPERWLEMFAAWPRRALLTPESPAQWGETERKLAELDFIILPATRAGLAAFAEILAGGREPLLEGELRTRPFPSLLRQNSKRWLENHEPAPARASKLCDQLKIFLGNRGYFWLSACAIYPMLYWELTLYLGFKLCGDRQEIEERLLSLVRLPWFRYGSIPDWLRLRLISALTPDEEKSVRKALEDLFLTMMQYPADGLQLKVADPKDIPHGFWQRLKTRLAAWKVRRFFWQILKSQPPESPLRDYVFLNFMSKRKPKKLSVSLPDTIRRLVFPQGQIVMGMRPAAALVLAIVFSLSILFFNWRVSARVIQPPTARFYDEMSDAEQNQFLTQHLSEILKTLGQDQSELSKNLDSIKREVAQYSTRIGSNSTQVGNEDLAFVFGRATSQFAPLINKAFSDRGMSPLLGLYEAMIASEFRQDALDRTRKKAGVFGLTTANAESLGLKPDQRTDTAKVSQSVAARFDSYRTNLIFSEPETFRDDTLKFLAAAVVGENPRSFRLDMEPLSTYTTLSAENTAEIADLVGRFGGSDRRAASDRLVQLYAQNKTGVIQALVGAVQSNSANSYRSNLYIARTLGLIQPNWDGSVDQIAKVLTLEKSRDYQDPTFKYWVDKAISNFNRNGIINCDCAKSEARRLTRPLYQDVCRQVETQLWQQIRDTGYLTGRCDPTASGPNAKPSSAPTPTESPSPSPARQIIVTLTAKPATIEVGQPVTFIARTRTTYPKMIYAFEFGDGSADSIPDGQITHIYPTAGTYSAKVTVRAAAQIGNEGISPGSAALTINVIKSGQAIMVTVPNVIGMKITDAEVTLKRVGLQSATESPDFAAQTPLIVVSQSPAAGTKVQPGTVVKLKACRNRDCR